MYIIFIFILASFTAKMKFIVKDCDPLTGEVQDDGYQEDYRVCIMYTYFNIELEFYVFFFYS